MPEFQRRIDISPAWNRRHSDPSKDYGIHCCNLHMVLIGEKGAVSFTLFTGWYLKPDAERLIGRGNPPEPQPADVGYHWKTPQYDGQEPSRDNCEYTGGPCYCDGSALQADDIFDILLEKGSDGVWLELESRYRLLANEDANA